jgi:hypothetical protein
MHHVMSRAIPEYSSPGLSSDWSIPFQSRNGTQICWSGVELPHWFKQPLGKDKSFVSRYLNFFLPDRCGIRYVRVDDLVNREYLFILSYPTTCFTSEWVTQARGSRKRVFKRVSAFL